MLIIENCHSIVCITYVSADLKKHTKAYLIVKEDPSTLYIYYYVFL